jgi:putative acetyltransferase
LSCPEVRLWSVWDGDQILAIGALKILGAGAAEVKSMRTHPDYLASDFNRFFHKTL